MSRAYALGIMAAIIYSQPVRQLDSGKAVDAWTATEALSEATKLLDAAEAQEVARLEREIEEARSK